MTDSVNEKSTKYLTVSFKDKNGVPATPITVNYRIDCLTSHTVILDDTALTPAANIEITITSAQNAIITGAATETRRVTIKAIYGAADGINAQYDYDVINLSGIT